MVENGDSSPERMNRNEIIKLGDVGTSKIPVPSILPGSRMSGVLDPKIVRENPERGTKLPR
jgi:hypothetical protein